MSQVGHYIQSQLDRFQRFLKSIGFQVQMDVLVSFWVQSQTKITKKGKKAIQPCSFICFHCCTNERNKKEIIKCKKSSTQNYRHRCSHSCSCNQYNHFRKTGTSKECKSTNPDNGFLDANDHPFTPFCALVYDPMDKNRPTINKWLDYLESTYSVNIDDDDDNNNDHEDSRSESSNSSQSESDSQSQSESESEPSPQPQPIINHNQHINVVNNMTYIEARKVLMIKKRENQERAEKATMHLNAKYQAYIYKLVENQSLAVWKIQKMAEENRQIIENEIRSLDEKYKRNEAHLREIEREKQKEREKDREMKQFKIVPFKLEYENNDAIEFNEERIENKIRRPQTAWMLYNIFKNQQLKKKSPSLNNLNSKQITKLNTKSWNSLNKSDKIKWQKKAENEKKEYQQIMDDLKKHNDLNKVAIKWRYRSKSNHTETTDDGVLTLPNLNRFNAKETSTPMAKETVNECVDCYKVFETDKELNEHICLKNKRKRSFREMHDNNNGINGFSDKQSQNAQRRRIS